MADQLDSARNVKAIREALKKGQSDCRLLDAREFDNKPWLDAFRRLDALAEQIQGLETALRLVDEPYPIEVFPERTKEQRDAIFAAMRSVDKYATEWFYAHVARERGKVARLVREEQRSDTGV